MRTWLQQVRASFFVTTLPYYGSGTEDDAALLLDLNEAPRDTRLPFGSVEGISSVNVIELPTTITPLVDVALVRFEVEDNGCGISAELMERIFKPFAQVWLVTLNFRA